MDHVQVRSSGGVFGLVGQLHLDRRRPVLVAVNGAFPNKTYLQDLTNTFPGVNTLTVYLPGMVTPWTDTDVPAMTSGLAEVLARLCGDSPIVLHGASTGALVALGLQIPNVVRKLATEPFFTTSHLWPFLHWARAYVQRNPERTGHRAFLQRLFGLRPDGTVEERDYRYLVERLAVPTEILVGAIPLGSPRALPTWPSLTSERDRGLLQAAPQVTIHVGGSGTGHAVDAANPGKAFIRHRMHAALREAAGLCG